MAKSKPKKQTKPTKYSTYKYDTVDTNGRKKKLTKNQREWNRQIDRLERYEKKHKGLNIPIPQKPTRITKKDLQELSAYKGKKILEQSTLTVPDTQEYQKRGLQGEVNAKEFLDNIVPRGTAKQREETLKKALRKTNENEPQPKGQAEPSEPTPEPTTERPTESTPIEDEDTDIFGDNENRQKMTLDDLTREQFWQAIATFEGGNAPQFREMMSKWYYAMVDELGEHEVAEIMREMMNSGDWIDRDVAYDLVVRGEWLTHFTSMVNDEDLRAWFYDYIQDLYNSQVGMTLEELIDSYY